jgi:sugar phosphate isomerase/epimerase
MMKFSGSTLAYREFPLVKALESLAGLEFKYVDIAAVRGYCRYHDICHIDPRTMFKENVNVLKEKLDSLGLKVASINAYWGAFNSLHNDARLTQIEFIKAAMNLARDLDSNVVCTWFGEETDLPLEKSIELSLKGANECVKYGKDLGVHLAFEIHIPPAIMKTVEEAIEIMTKSPDAAICLDVSHIAAAQFAGWSHVAYTESVKKLDKRIGHVHLRDAKGYNIFVPPGKGEIDFPKFISELKNINYQDGCTLELEFAYMRIEEIEKEMKDSINYLKTCFSYAGIKV